MSSGGPPPAPTPAALQPGDRVRVVGGMFAAVTGVVLGPAPAHPDQPAVLVELAVWERPVYVAFPTQPGQYGPGYVEPAPPAG